MEMPEGWKTLKKLAKIPVVIEGEKKARLTYTIPEIKIACELMKEMANALVLANTGIEILYSRKNHLTDNNDEFIETFMRMNLDRTETVLKKFKEWK